MMTQQVQRIGVSLENELLERFDRLIERQGYTARSEAIRDLIRSKLTDEQLADPETQALAAVMVVYDHHQGGLSRKLIELQHNEHLNTVSALHVHLDKHHCLEVILLQGKVREITALGEQLVSIKGVELGKVNLITTEK